MAKFNAEGIDGLMLSFQEMQEIPDDVVEDMLEAAGDVVVDAQRQSIIAMGLVDSGRLLNSIKAHAKIGRINGQRKRYVLVYPEGKHGTRNRKQVTKAYKRSKHGRTYTVGGDTVDVTNNEVGFIHEFGAPKKGIPAQQWMRAANEACADAMVQAELAVYDRWLKSKDL